MFGWVDRYRFELALRKSGVLSTGAVVVDTPHGVVLQLFVAAGSPDASPYVLRGILDPDGRARRGALERLTTQTRWPVFLFDRCDGTHVADQMVEVGRNRGAIIATGLSLARGIEMTEAELAQAATVAADVALPVPAIPGRSVTVGGAR